LSELLLVILGLTLLLGLMVSLARRVRRESSHNLAERVLVELEVALDAYRSAHDRLPGVMPLLPREDVDEAEFESTLAGRVLPHNRQVVAALGLAELGEARADSTAVTALDALGLLAFDGQTLRDPWGTPIAYLPRYDPRVGMAAGDRPFFFSAGPDRRFLTREDNVYSYEALRRRLDQGLSSAVDGATPTVDNP
jgi:type II secretory pathway pseudopilin PulG